MNTPTPRQPLTLTTCAPRLRWRLPENPDQRVYMTLAAMEGIATTYAAHPAVRAVAAGVTPRAAFLAGPRGQVVNLQAEERNARLSAGFALNLYHWLRASITFQADPPTTETIRDPADLLAAIVRDGSTSADCDDLATLAAAVIVAGLGQQAAGFAVVSKTVGGNFQHVYPIVWNGPSNEQQHTFPMHLDPQEGTPFNDVPNGTRRIHLHRFTH
jgi:hypothetical protein